MSKQLQVGDVLYNDEKSPTRKVTIDRVTEKRAFSTGGYMFSRMPEYGRYIQHAASYSDRSNYLETPEISALFKQAKEHAKQESDRRTIARQVSDTKFNYLTFDQLTRILTIINEQK